MYRIAIKYRFCSLILFIFLLVSCNRSAEKFAIADLQIEWVLEENKIQPAQLHQAKFLIKNIGSKKIQSGWEIYFNTIFLDVDVKSETAAFEIEHVSGDLFRMYPTDEFDGIAPENTFEVSYSSNNSLLKNSHAPEGLYLVFNDEDDGILIENYSKENIKLKDLKLAAANTGLPIPTYTHLFEQNEGMQLLDRGDFSPIIPTPKYYEISDEEQVFAGELEIFGEAKFEESAKFMEKSLQGLINNPIRITDDKDKARIHLIKDESIASDEGYHLQVGDAIVIKAKTEKGIFYGVQSLLGLIPWENWNEAADKLTLPISVIEDEPRFGYRGLFLDVARNFQTKEAVLKLLDLMAFYKLNVFHFNLANDEGWRIEIPDLPELTEVGSKRGFSKDGTKFLMSYYGSGPNPDDSPNGSGYYSRADFIEILQYAKARHIKVIPEIGVPGHSRAAIHAMRNRYHKHMEEGNEDEATKYLLEDFEDQSEYLSAQNFKGNTLCICQESTFTFYSKVIDEIQLLYSEAGTPLEIFHTGGDEVPKGAWEKSPTCREFIESQESIQDVADLPTYFYNRIAEMFQNKGIQVAGWEEIGQKEVELNGRSQAKPNPEFSNQNFQLYAWNSVAGWGGEDMGYQLANAGYDVILCNSSNLYFDLAYNMDPDEPGHQWSGFVDMNSAWRTVPMNHFISNDKDMYGGGVEQTELRGELERLTDEGRKNIKGIQGQLWTETVKGQEMMEYYLLPKMLGLVERAWASDPDWANETDSESRIIERQVSWNKFANAIGQNEIPRLDYMFGGFNTRIPKAGGKIVDGLLHLNIETPGLLIRYTKNGTEPDAGSPIYSAPLPFEGKIMARVFSPSGRAGKISTCK